MSGLSSLATGKWTALWYKMFVHICCFFIPVIHSMISWHFILFLHESGCFHSQPERARHATQHDTSNDIVKACPKQPTPLGIWLLADSDLSQWPFNEMFMKWWTESVGYKSFHLISNKSSLATQPSSAALFCCCHSGRHGRAALDAVEATENSGHLPWSGAERGEGGSQALARFCVIFAW